VGTRLQLDTGAYTARVKPTVTFGAARGVQASATPLMERQLFASDVSKYADSRKPPANNLKSNVPARVEIARVGRANKRGMPAAFVLITIAFWMPGPHHSFSVVRPAVIRPKSTSTEL